MMGRTSRSECRSGWTEARASRVTEPSSTACPLVTQDGLPITDKPKFLIYHPSQEKDVIKLLKTSSGQPDTPDHSVNSLTLYGLIPISCRHLTSTYWFVAGSKFPKDFIFYWRIRKEVKQEGDFDRDAIKIKARQRYSVGLRDWTYIVGNPGA